MGVVRSTDAVRQDEAALLERCRSGDPLAWEEIVRTHSRRIYNICYRFTGSAADAQDLAQEVFIKTYRNLARYDPAKAAFATWLTAVARNALLDFFRRSRQDRLTDPLDPASDDGGAPSPADRLADPRAATEAGLARRDARDKVHTALQALDPEHREVVILRDLQDMDYAEIAVVLGIPEGTVKSRLSRGRAELARVLLRTYGQVHSR